MKKRNSNSRLAPLHPAKDTYILGLIVDMDAEQKAAVAEELVSMAIEIRELVEGFIEQKGSLVFTGSWHISQPEKQELASNKKLLKLVSGLPPLEKLGVAIDLERMARAVRWHLDHDHEPTLVIKLPRSRWKWRMN